MRAEASGGMYQVVEHSPLVLAKWLSDLEPDLKASAVASHQGNLPVVGSRVQENMVLRNYRRHRDHLVEIPRGIPALTLLGE